MSLLKMEPPAPVRTLEELFAIAHAMEHEAATLYAEIAVRMRRDGSPRLAEVFEHLSADERGHMEGIKRWSESQHQKAPDPALIRWRIPETFDDEGVFATDPRLLSAYRALSMAVRNEQRAFAFWSYVAAHAGTADIRKAAETMAHEELGHVATLRRERRKAFHVERSQAVSREDAQVRGGGLADLERRLADLLVLLAEQAAPQDRARIMLFAAEAARHAQELAESPIPISDALSINDLPDAPLVLAEHLADRYLEAGDLLRDEGELGRVQVLAGRAIARLAWLRSDLPELQAT